MKKYNKRSPFRALALLSGMFFAFTVAAPQANACDACNFSFLKEMLENRADTPAGRDLLAAMDNQAGLPLDSFSTMPPHLVEALRNSPARAQLASYSNDAPVANEPASASENEEQAPAAATPEPQTEEQAPAAAAPEPQTEEQAQQSDENQERGRRGDLSLYEGHDFIEIIERDLNLPTAPTSYVPQTATPDKSFTITLHEGKTYMGNNVMYDGFLTDGMIPGPTIIIEEGDIVEFTVVNDGDVPHGASIHAAYTQTSKYMGSIQPGESKTVLFRANHPGVYMYHCAPGGHAIPMHVLFGQYGMMVVKPKEQKFRMEEELGHPPDVEIYLVQHEWYANGKDAVEGNPAYVTFNGKIFRYIEEPIQAKPGDYVRIYFLNVGPNLLSTFHLVGIIWDYAYWQGHPANIMTAGQTVTAGPSDSWVVEFRVPPDEGPYLMLSHAVGSTSKGAIGILAADRNAETPVVVKADGPTYTPQQLEDFSVGALRTISPFKPGTLDYDRRKSFGNETKEVTVQIIGNSYYPKVLEITPGTTVTFVNEDVFSYLAGEFSGIHNAAVTSGPERFVTPLLSHAESYSVTLTEEGEYTYICTPHPYMEAKIIVRSVEEAGAGGPGLGVIAVILSILALLIAAGTLATRRK